MTTAINKPAPSLQIPALDTKVATVRKLMLGSRAQIELALPKHLSADRLIRVAMTSIITTPKLIECSQRSLLGAVIQCAQLGLEPGILGMAYLVPFWNSRASSFEVQLIPGYRGLLALARRSGEISTIIAHEVRVGDAFKYEYGLEPILRHTPSEAVDRHTKDISHFYAVARLKDGGVQFEVMTKAEVDHHRDRYSKAAKAGPWVTDYTEMGKKTALRRLSKLLPVSIELQTAVALSEQAEVQIPQHLGDLTNLEPASEEAGGGKGGQLDQLTASLQGGAEGTQGSDGAAGGK